MSPWYAKVVVLAATILMVAIRAPHGRRSRKLAVARSFRGRLEIAVLAVAAVAFLAPIVWIASPALAFADYPPRPIPLAAGALLMAIGLALFHRSHADLGSGWSITLEVRAAHRLITGGIYRRIRHPMYLALLVYSAGQAVALPNAVAGPSYLVAMAILIACRLGPEERMMLETFGPEYERYRSRSWRLIPWLW